MAAREAKDASGLLSPRFRSAAALVGWDEESLLHAALVVEDTPVRESRRKRRAASNSSSAGGSSGGSAGSNTRKRRMRRKRPGSIPSVVLLLDDDDKKPDIAADGNKEVKEEEKKNVVVGEESSSEKAAAAVGRPCMDRLREELSCAICLEICFEPSTTPCGHSFCMKCLKHAAAKCGKNCPKCRQLIRNSRSCTVNTVLWNTIQLLFPSEIEARRSSMASSSESNDGVVQQISKRSNSIAQGGIRSSSFNSNSNITQRRTRSSSFIIPGSRRNINPSGSFITEGSSTTTGRGFVRASQLASSTGVVSVGSDQSGDATLAYRLQQEEFMTAFDSEGERQPPRSSSSTVSAARANLRAMASRAIRLRARGWPV